MKSLPKDVCTAAQQISTNPAYLDLIREDWPRLELAAQVDRYFGQVAVPFSKGDREALNALQALRAWAGPESGYARGLAPYAGGVTEEEIMRAMATLQQLEDVLAVQAARRGKLKKRFLPALAECVCDWHCRHLRQVPAWGIGAPAVVLMLAIAAAFQVVLDDSSFTKALGKAIGARKEC